MPICLPICCERPYEIWVTYASDYTGTYAIMCNLHKDGIVIFEDPSIEAVVRMAEELLKCR